MATKEFNPPQAEIYLLFDAYPSKWQIDKVDKNVFGEDQHSNPYTNSPAFLFPWHKQQCRGDKVSILFWPTQSMVPDPDTKSHPLRVLFPQEVEIIRVVEEYLPVGNKARTLLFCGPIHNSNMTPDLLIMLGRLEVFYGYADNQVRFSELLSRIGISLSRGSSARKEAA